MNEESRNSYPDDAAGRQRLWVKEFASAREWLREWRESGDRVVGYFLDERQDDEADATHLNFYWANIKTLLSMLYGKLPRVAVQRSFGDPNDDVARVAALMLERILNSDIERYADGFRDALGYVLADFLVPGFGNARVRYEAKFQTIETKEQGKKGTPRYAPAVSKKQKVPGTEDAVSDYHFWKDQLWSPCRTHADKRWHAFMSPMTRDDLHERFDAVLGKDAVEKIPLHGRLFGNQNEPWDNKREDDDPWSRAEVWEIWDKQKHEVVWFVEGYDRVLDVKSDPLGLSGFWPSPRPMMANVTTTRHVPRPDYALAQDLYNDINILATRITELEDALRVAGVYDASLSGLSRILDEDVRNELIPIQAYPALMEKGGMERIISWLPIGQVAEVLDKSRELLADKQRLLYEITGWSDIMRGQAEDSQQLATTTRAVVKFGSVRVQAILDEFARYASDFQRLRAEIIVKFFDDRTILERSNIMQTPDRDLALQALQALRRDFLRYTVSVKPEAIAMTDFASMKAERTEFMTAFSQLIESVARLGPAIGPQSMTAILPLLGEIVKWVLAGYRGSSSIEGIVDKMLAAANVMAQRAQAAGAPQQPPDPKLLAQQFKARADSAREAQKVQSEQQRQEIKTQAEVQRQQAQLQYNIAEFREKARIQASTAEKRMALSERQQKAKAKRSEE